MQEVCSSIIDSQLGPIKSESSPLIGQQQVVVTQQQTTPPSSLKMQCDKRDNGGSNPYWIGGVAGTATESGFINSQPSMAEFLNIGPESPKMGTFPMVVSPSDSGMEGVPEYPWMKEKKTARKNSAAQGTNILQRNTISSQLL